MDNKWTQEQIFEDDNIKKEYGVGYTFKKSKIKITGRKSRKFGFVFFIFFVALLALIGNLAGNIVTASKNSSSSIKLAERDYYAISVANYISVQLASQLANEIRTMGGAGYIYPKQNAYYVLTSIYDKKDDALAVSAKLKDAGYKPEVLEFKANEKKYNYNLNDNDKQVLNNLISVFDESYKTLSNISYSFDKKEETLSSCKQKVLDLIDKYDDVYENYISTFNETDLNDFDKLTKNLHNIFESLDKLTEPAVTETEFTYCVKYSCISIAMARLLL